VGNNTDCPFTEEAGDQVGTNTEPVYPLLGPLQNNGGPTDTHALLFGSPAIDAVVDCLCTTVGGDPVTMDQRGAWRPADGDDDGTSHCDIGAYEKQPPKPPPPEPDEGDGDVAVGGMVESIDLSQLDMADIQQPVGEGKHTSVSLWIAMASALGITGGLLALRRRRVH